MFEQLNEKALGIPLYLDDSIGWIKYAVQVRFPRSRRKRIRLKWSRDPKNCIFRRLQLPRVRAGSHLESPRFYVNTPMLQNLRRPARDEFEKFCRESVVIMNCNLRLPPDRKTFRIVDTYVDATLSDLLDDEPFVWDIVRHIDSFGDRAAKSPMLQRFRRLLIRNRAGVWGS